MSKKSKINDVLEGVRHGLSLYGACTKAKMSSREFYEIIRQEPAQKEAFLLALSDYADQCMDDIRSLALGLKNKELDTSTAKLLIETQKWLAQKACPEPLSVCGGDMDVDKTTEIVVKFI